MVDKKEKQGLANLVKNSNIVLAGTIVAILGVMIIPLPTFLLDVLLVMSITGGLVILFVALYSVSPLEFSVFPGLLLIITLFRLSLNVATTRLILGQGYAGEVIESFGSFVVQGNYIVGLVMFIILVIINFVVITKGSARIAEVSARFTLDAMPGKQMAIDADLNAGLIDDIEAQRRRGMIAREADFYGAMDGASKFVRGDAIAGLLITAINILGGLSIGVLQRGLSIGEAVSTYTLLTIGDGLVAQIPALIVSTSAGIIITRATSESDMGSDIATQITRQPKAILITSVVLGGLGIVPGLPFIPFILMALVLFGSGYILQKNQKLKTLEGKVSEEEVKEIEEKIEDYIHPDPFEIEIGYGLIPLVDTQEGGNLLDRISTIRKSLAIELGVIVPPIRIRDNIQLKSNQYVFKIYGIEVASGEVMPDRYLVLNPGADLDVKGIDTVEPTFGLPARWISKKDKEKVEAAGYSVVEPHAIIATHLMEVLRNNTHKLLDRQETKRMLDHLKETHPAVVENLVPEVVSLGTITQILKNLLREKVPIRNLVLILETIADYAHISKDPDILTEYVRAALAETITDYFKGDNDKVVVITLEPRLEDSIMEAIRKGSGKSHNLGLSPQQVNKLFNSLSEKVEQMLSRGVRPVVLVSPQIRRVFRNFIEPILPNVSVISHSELTPDTNVESIGVIRNPDED